MTPKDWADYTRSPVVSFYGIGYANPWLSLTLEIVELHDVEASEFRSCSADWTAEMRRTKAEQTLQRHFWWLQLLP